MAQMKFLVLDLDQTHNSKVKQILSSVPDMNLQFFESADKMLQVINGFPEIEIKKKELEKAIVDAKALKDKITASIEAAKKPFEGKKIEGKVADQIKKAEELLKSAEDAAKSREQELEEINKSALKPEEKKCHLYIVDRSFLGSYPQKWVEDFKGKIQLSENKDVPIITMGYNESIDYIKQTIVPGVRDYFIKPVDALLLKNNSLKISGQKVDSSDKMFELQTTADIKMLLVSKIKKMSEFDIEVQSSYQFVEHQTVEFQADNFSKEKGGRMFASCIKSAPDESEKGKYISNFSFIGLSSHLMNEMRKWIRAQYALQKSKSSE